MNRFLGFIQSLDLYNLREYGFILGEIYFDKYGKNVTDYIWDAIIPNIGKPVDDMLKWDNALYSDLLVA